MGARIGRPPSPLTGPDDPRHGTSGAYDTHKCRCAKCKEGNSARKAAYRRKNADQVRSYRAEYRLRNAERLRSYEAERWAANSDKLKDKNAAYRAANTEKERERYARYYAENRDARRLKWSDWRRSPEGRASARVRNRRRKERARARYCGCDTRENLHAVWELDAGLCAYCGAEGTDYEHVVPLARGGWGCVSNFRVACKSCNSRKGTKPLSVFLERLAASGVEVRPGATNSGLPCPAAAERMSTRMLTAAPE